jgi:hypothetical protein
MSDDVSVTKFAKGLIMTDTCNTARKIQQLLHVKINKIFTDNGLSDEEVELHTSYCWQHLCNVWFGAVELALNNTLLNQLEESLASIPSIYRVNMDIVNLYQGTEKMVGATENYHKGRDLCVEDAPSILRNLPLYLQFLHWHMCVCGTSGYGILATNLYMNFRSMEVVALLRVLAILYSQYVCQIRWLAGKTESLSHYDFWLL